MKWSCKKHRQLDMTRTISNSEDNRNHGNTILLVVVIIAVIKIIMICTTTCALGVGMAVLTLQDC